MTTPDHAGPDEPRFEAAFADLAHTAEAMVDPAPVGALHRRVRRRRATRGAAGAAVAAVLVALPALWWLQASGQALDAPPAGDFGESAVMESPSSFDPSPPTLETEDAMVGDGRVPTFDDLLGATLDLPAFGTSDPSCETAPATISDGVPDWKSLEGESEYTDAAETPLLKVIHTPLEKGGPVRAVALLECWSGTLDSRQAVVVAGDDEGGWMVTEQLLVSGGEHGSIEDLAPADGYGVIFLMRETDEDFVCCEGDQSEIGTEEVWYLQSRPRDDEPLVAIDDPGPASMVTDLTLHVKISPDGEGYLTTVNVSNTGDRTSAPYLLSLCGTEHAGFAGDMPACDKPGNQGVLVGDPLEPGEVYEAKWAMDIPPSSQWNADELGYGIQVSVQVEMVRYSQDELIFDPYGADNYDSAVLSEADHKG
ncbi:hypothetical protein AB0B28_05675 [Glycomyces sp. NPDC046736]|uniref:hypothetical protein n=1 Tax=Glycomyces sp. NPDC046736 TaxID=3155615 RepID=UPI003407B6F7